MNNRCKRWFSGVLSAVVLLSGVAGAFPVSAETDTTATRSFTEAFSAGTVADTELSAELSTMDNLAIAAKTQEEADRQFGGYRYRLYRKTLAGAYAGFKLADIDEEAAALSALRFTAIVRSGDTFRVPVVEVSTGERGQWVTVPTTERSSVPSQQGGYIIKQYTATLSVADGYQWLRFSFGLTDSYNYTMSLSKVTLDYTVSGSEAPKPSALTVKAVTETFEADRVENTKLSADLSNINELKIASADQNKADNDFGGDRYRLARTGKNATTLGFKLSDWDAEGIALSKVSFTAMVYIIGGHTFRVPTVEVSTGEGADWIAVTPILEDTKTSVTRSYAINRYEVALDAARKYQWVRFTISATDTESWTLTFGDVTLEYMAPATVTAVESTTVTMVAGDRHLPRLPEQVQVTYDDGSVGMAAVEWEDLTEADFKEAGRVTVTGKVAHSQAAAQCLVTVQAALAYDAKTGFQNFVRREGNRLYDGDTVFKSVVAGTTALFHSKDTGSFRLPSAEELDDAFLTTKQMGGTWLRTYTITMGTGDWCMVQGAASKDGVTDEINPDAFNEAAFQHMDLVLAKAREHGIRLVIPITDYHGHVGGNYTIAAFRGCAAPNANTLFTDTGCQADYKAIVKYILNRTNTITGVRYKDDPTILAWQTGNELCANTGPLEAYDAWDRMMTAYIRSQDANHLIASGAYVKDQGVRESILTDPNTDIIDAHYYGSYGPDTFTSKFQGHLDRIKSVDDKVFMIGEFGFGESTDIIPFLETVVSEDCIMGAQLWSMRVHTRDGGYYSHSEVTAKGRLWYSHTWPGNAAETFDAHPKLVDLVYEYAYKAIGVATPPRPAPSRPRILDYATIRDLRFFGATGAARYIIERAESPDGPWTVLTEDYDEFGTPYDYNTIQLHEPFKDTTAAYDTAYYYRVTGVNPEGVMGEPSEVAGPLTIRSTHTVTVVNGVDEAYTVEAATDQLLTAPDVPVKEGKVFRGWYRDAAFQLPWDFDTDTVEEDSTLYAKWVSVGHTVMTFTGWNRTVTNNENTTREYWFLNNWYSATEGYTDLTQYEMGNLHLRMQVHLGLADGSAADLPDTLTIEDMRLALRSQNSPEQARSWTDVSLLKGLHWGDNVIDIPLTTKSSSDALDVTRVKEIYFNLGIRELKNAMPGAYSMTVDNACIVDVTAEEELGTVSVVGNGRIAIVGGMTYGKDDVLSATTSSAGSRFVGWRRNDTFYTADKLETPVTGSERITAYFVDADETAVVYTGKYNRIIDVQVVKSADKLTAVTAPAIVGQAFTGWDITAKDLAAVIEGARGGFTTVSAVYTTDMVGEGYAVTLTNAVRTNGSALTGLNFDTRIEVKAAAVEGKIFSHWTIDGNVASYKDTYTFYVSGNNHVEAVYADTAATPELHVAINQVMVTKIAPDNYTISMIAQTYLPEGCTLMEYGLIYAPTQAVAEDPARYIQDKDYLKIVASSRIPNRQYQINLYQVKPGKARYGVAYVTVRTADGQIQTVYSAIKKAVAADTQA